MDTSKCGAYDEGKCYSDEPDTKHLYCKDNKNCSYKQKELLKSQNRHLKEALELALKEKERAEFCIYEIEKTIEICKTSRCGYCKYYYDGCTTIDDTILQIIKKSKEGNNE